MSNIETIRAVINTLEQVTVCGSGNMSRLLGCIQTLAGLEKSMEAAKGVMSNASEHEGECTTDKT